MHYWINLNWDEKYSTLLNPAKTILLFMVLIKIWIENDVKHALQHHYIVYNNSLVIKFYSLSIKIMLLLKTYDFKWI